MKATPAIKTCTGSGRRTAGINAWATCSVCGVLTQVDRRSGRLLSHRRKGEKA